MVGTQPRRASFPITEASPLERPITRARDSKAGAVKPRSSAGDIPWRLEPHDEKSLDIAEHLRGSAATFFENEIALQHSDLVNAVLVPRELEQRGLMVTV